MKKITEVKALEKKAIEIRRDIVTMLEKAGSGHTGGSLSIVEILVSLYYTQMNISPKNQHKKDRDKFILSKGHACPALYAVLADLKFFPKEELWTLRKLGSRLQGHPEVSLPGMEASTGSLGQGLSISVGLALANRIDAIDANIYCLMGDGETNEGQVWEAAMTAAHYKLDKLCAIVDFNKLQIDGRCCEVQDLGEYKNKWENFGWHTVEVNGHDFAQLDEAFKDAREAKDRPQMVIAHTTKGRGISFVENKAEWHGIAPKPEELEQALAELDAQEKAIK